MKKRITFLSVAVLAVMQISCLGRNNQNNDAAEEATDAAELAAQPATVSFTATATGVGPIQLNMPVGDVPAAVEGLYDAVETKTLEVEDMGDIYYDDQMSFTLDGELTMLGHPSDGNLRAFKVLTPRVASPEGIAPGMPVEKLFAAGAETLQYNDGSFHYKLGDLIFTVSGEFSDSGAQKFDEGYRTGKNFVMTAADYKSGATIECIEYMN